MKLSLITLTFVVMLVSAKAQTFYADFTIDDQGDLLTAGVSDVNTNAPYENLFASGEGMHLSTGDNVNRPLNLYNTEGQGGEDDDLERKTLPAGANPAANPLSDRIWAGGNSTSGIFDNVLIVNETSNIGVPDDDGVGGRMILSFDRQLTSFGFDFIDMDSANNADLILRNRATNQEVTISFLDFQNGSGSVFERTDVLFGNRHANQISEFTAVDAGLASFDEVEFALRSSGGIGSVYGTAIPEPSAAVLALAGSTLLFRRRRK